MKKLMLSTAGVFGALVLATGGWLGWKFLNNSGKIFGGSVLSNIGGLINSAPLKGQESGRVNILLAGNSADDVGHDGALLTDSIMLASIDTDNNKAFTLSIPRDLWVNIPGVGNRKINEANYWGEENNFSEKGFPKGGMGLLEKTLETTFDIDIHYYGLINYGAFKDSVDTVGGIKVDIESDDPRGLYDPTFGQWEGGPLKLANGVHKLNGDQALKLARARGHDGGYGYAASDFTRSDNQRKMLLALKDKALNAGTISNPIKIGNLMDSIGNNLHTDFKLNEISTLVGFGNKIKTVDSLSFEDKDTRLLDNYTTSTGQSALIPTAGIGDYSDIITFLNQHMSHDPIVREAAKVSVLNGTQVNGLASGQEEELKAKNLNVQNIGTSDKQYANTTIIVKSGNTKTSTKAWLAKKYKGVKFVGSSDKLANSNAKYDFIIILGQDFANRQNNKSTN